MHAYSVYEAMPDRSYIKLVQALGKTSSYQRRIEYWASAYDWQARVVAYDIAQREKLRAQRDADDAKRHDRQLARELRRDDQRAEMDDQRAFVFGQEWARVLKVINFRLDRTDKHGNPTPDIKGLVGLVALLKLSLDEQRVALGGAAQPLDLARMAQDINSAAGIAMAREIMKQMGATSETRDAIALALLAETQADASLTTR